MINAFWWLLTHDLLEDRRKDDVTIDCDFAFFVSYKTNRFNVPVGLYRKRSQKTSKCCKNISDTLNCASCPPPPPPPYFDVICEQTHSNMESSCLIKICCGQLTVSIHRYLWVHRGFSEHTRVSMGLHEYTKVPVVKQRFTRAYTGTWLRKFILSLHVATQYFLFEAKPVIVQISNLKNSTYTPYFEYNEAPLKSIFSQFHSGTKRLWKNIV